MKINKVMRGKNVLVTGAAGFMGSHLIRRLLERDCRVAILLKSSTPLWRIEDLLDDTEVLYGDLSDIKTRDLETKLSKMQIIYHLGAAGVDQSNPDIDSMLGSNVMGTLNMLRLAYNLKVERFIYCGSCFEYKGGNSLSEDILPAPLSEYGASKASACILVNTFFRKYGLPTVSLRPFTVYGPFESPYRLICHTILSVLEGKDIELTGGKQTRDFIFIDDVIDGFLAAAAVPEIEGETFNLSTGNEVSVKEIVTTIIELMEGRVKPLFGTRPYRDGELWSLSGDPSKAQKTMQWKAQTTLREGLSKTIRWFEQNRLKYPIYVR